MSGDQQQPPVRGQLSPAARQELEQRGWYGNIRELRNAIEHAMIVARGGHVMPEHFPPPMPASVVDPQELDLQTEIHLLLSRWTAAKLQDAPSAGKIYEQLLRLVEPPVLRSMVRHQAGQVAGAARLLGMHRTTLRKKLGEYDLENDGKT